LPVYLFTVRNLYQACFAEHNASVTADVVWVAGVCSEFSVVDYVVGHFTMPWTRIV